MSLLSWERGLKYYAYVAFKWSEVVAPLVGAWIEIANKGTIDWDNVVAPLVGAWIEIYTPINHNLGLPSLLSWERGLKLLILSIYGLLDMSLLSWERGLK